MKIQVKWLIIIFTVAVAGFLAFKLFLGLKRTSCLEGEGPQAAEACTFLLSVRYAGFRAEYLVRRSELLGKENKWDEVLTDLNEIIAMNHLSQLPPAKVLAVYESLSRIHIKKGNMAEVKKFQELAVRNDCRDVGLFLSLASIYIEEKKFQEALNLLETAGGLESAKKHPFYNVQASAYEGLNDYEKAYAALKAGLAVPAPRPVLAATSKHLGLVCFELKRYQEAETYLGYTLKAGLDCPECGLLLTTIRGALQPAVKPAGSRSRKPRK